MTAASFWQQVTATLAAIGAVFGLLAGLWAFQPARWFLTRVAAGFLHPVNVALRALVKDVIDEQITEKVPPIVRAAVDEEIGAKVPAIIHDETSDLRKQLYRNGGHTLADQVHLAMLESAATREALDAVFRSGRLDRRRTDRPPSDTEPADPGPPDEPGEPEGVVDGPAGVTQW